MVADVGNILNAVQQQQLTVLKGTASGLDSLQLQLATGKEVNTALDAPGNFFVSKALDNRASDLQRLLDAIDKSISTIELAQQAIDSMNTILDTAESFLNEYRLDLAAGNIEVQENVDTSFFIDFADPTNFINYGGTQDSGVPVTIIEDGFGVIFDDNAWRRFPFNYTVTTDTIIEFDFLSTNIPEIIPISFEDNNTFNDDPYHFFIYGTQLTGVPYAVPTGTFQYDGSGEWRHIQIPVGTFYTGNFSSIAIIGDDDGGGDDGDGYFRNMVVHEGDYVFGQTSLSVSNIYEQQYSRILNQLDLLAEDATYRGVNLLEGDDLTVYFNEQRTSSLTIEGRELDSYGLELDRTNFATLDAVDEKIEQVRLARETLRNYTRSLAVDFGILDGRSDFISKMVNTLIEGSDELVLSDQNEVGAELIALQTRQLIQTNVLTINTASIADFLI